MVFKLYRPEPEIDYDKLLQNEITKFEAEGGVVVKKKEYVITKIKNIETSNEWVNVKGVVKTLWTPKSEKISQTGIFKDLTGEIKFTIWKISNQPILEVGKAYTFDNVVTGSWNGNMNISINKKSKITKLAGKQNRLHINISD